jgi:hypothetical protein
MSRISPAPPDRFAEVAEHMERWKKTKGYPPNSRLTMLRKPRVFRAYRDLHTAENAAHIAGVPAGKVEALAAFRTSALFTAAERTALELARAAGACPPQVTDTHFDELKRHFSENAITEMVAVISLLGWLTRWNVTLATGLEPDALEFAEKHLAVSGWTPGAHAPKS